MGAKGDELKGKAKEAAGIMYVGVGTVVVILVIVLIINFARRAYSEPGRRDGGDER